MTDLDGKRCLVVGAGSGIGRGVVDTFRELGAAVTAFEIDPGKCDALARAGVAVEQGDATSWDDNRRAVAAAVATHGGLDVLVNCVGRFDFYRGLEEIDDASFDAAFDEIMTTNVAGQLIGAKVALPHLRESAGSVVLTCSTSSFGPGRGGILYVSSKFALRGAVLALADELAPEVRVNAVAPGGTTGTDLRGLGSLGQSDRSLGDTPRREDDIRDRSRLDVALSPADHAHCYAFLASDAAKGMTGRFLHPDGGANLPAG